jgi:hypothetical protein
LLQYKTPLFFFDLELKSLLKIKQVLLDSCSSKRMQAEDKHKALDQSSQPSTDPEASKQYIS